MSATATWPVWRRNAAWYVAGLAALVLLKLFYSRAGPDELGFILAPTARLTGMLSGVVFEREAGAGWVSHTEHVILGTACAGVNFMIIALATLYFPFVSRFQGIGRRAAWLGASAGLAYAAAVVTNSLRLVAAMTLWRMDIYTGPVTPDRVHRTAGTIIYCLSVLALYLTATRLFERLEGRAVRQRSPSALVPLGWYAAVALGVPLARRAWRTDPARFAEHAVLVVLVCLMLAVGAMLLRAAARGPGINGPDRKGGERPAG